MTSKKHDPRKIPSARVQAQAKDHVPTGVVLPADPIPHLNGWDSQPEGSSSEARSGTDSGRMDGSPVRVFIIHSSEEESLLREFYRYLKPLQRSRLIECWDDHLIGAGQEWNYQISDNLGKADLILFLVTAFSLASDFVWDIEMRRALEQHKAGTSRLIPVIIGDVDWSDAPFATLQVAPSNGKAIRLWRHRDTGWRLVVSAIRAAAQELRKT